MVVIDFVAAPPTFDVKTVSDFLLTNDCEMRAGQQLHEDAKKNIECNRANGALTGVIIALPPANAGGREGSISFTLESYPGEHLKAGSWHAAQDEMRNTVTSMLNCGLPIPIGWS